jgi:transposase
VVNPSRIKKYAESRLARNKTDKGDAALIADFCLTQAPEPWTPPAPELRALRAMVRYLADLQQMRQQELNRLQAGVRSPSVTASLTEHVAFLDQQMAALLGQIRAHIDQHPDLKRQTELLTSIPGIGDLTAFSFLAEVGDLSAFDSADQVAAYAGLTPCQRQSGSSLRGQAHLSRIGNPALRRALYFPALTAMRHNPPIAALAQRLTDRHKPKMVVVAAAMHKLCVIAFGVLKSGQPFDPAFSLHLQVTS